MVVHLSVWSCNFCQCYKGKGHRRQEAFDFPTRDWESSEKLHVFRLWTTSKCKLPSLNMGKRQAHPWVSHTWLGSGPEWWLHTRRRTTQWRLLGRACLCTSLARQNTGQSSRQNTACLEHKNLETTVMCEVQGYNTLLVMSLSSGFPGKRDKGSQEKKQLSVQVKALRWTFSYITVYQGNRITLPLKGHCYIPSYSENTEWIRSQWRRKPGKGLLSLPPTR